MMKLSLPLFILFFSVSLFAQYTWELKQSGSGRGNPLAVDPNNKNIIYYGSSNRLYKSTDRGDSFSPFGNQIPGSSSVKAVTVSSYNPDVIVVATYTSVVKTTNAGLNWTTTASNLDFSFYGIPMDQDPSHPDSLYFMDGTAMMHSSDFGSTWTQISTVPIQGPPCDIEIVKDTSIILVGDNFVGIVRSTDYGYNWNTVYSTSGEIPTIATDRNKPGIGYATKFAGGGGLLKTTNYGATWNVIAFNGTNTWGVHIAPDNSDYVLTGTWSGSNVYISRNEGSSWITTNLPPSNYAVLVIDTMNVFAAQSGGVYKLDSPFFTPVELTSFTVKIVEGEAHLEWTTATEINNQGFEVEVSNDNINFNKIGFIPGFGTSTTEHSYSFKVDKLSPGKNYFRLKQIDFDGTYEYSSTIEADGVMPDKFYLAQNHPNPFNPSTSIEFSIPADAFVQIELYNLLGEKVSEIINEEFSAGIHTINYTAGNLSSGTYLYTFKAKSSDGRIYSGIKKLILLK